MSALSSSVIMDGIEYSVIVVEGNVVGFKRYHAHSKKAGVWVELYFSEEGEPSAEDALLSRLIDTALSL